MSKSRKILVTHALPYANGDLHLGHILGYVQSDIWVRYQKLSGHTCYYICGDDAHGTPIMMNARKKGISPEKLIAEYFESHQKDFHDFNIEFDNYYTTHSKENQFFAESIFAKLKENGDIFSQSIEQAYDEKENLFLPDRFIQGDCPRCQSPAQYGDSCEVCGATYSPMDLKNPLSVLSQTAPVMRSTTHFFFNLPHYEEALRQWTQSGAIPLEIQNKLSEWFQTGLKPWDISRDAPYFGFQIPGHPELYFYVSMDAPMGYMASFKNYCDIHPDVDFNDYWSINSSAELVHFIGKDITYFHSLFWPAVLSGAGYRCPSAIYVNGFLTVNGEKMSKSRGTFILARRFLEHAPSDFLRYYFAAKLSASVEDIDLNLSDFVQRINADLVGKYINIAARTAKFIHEYFDGKLIDQFSAKNLNIFQEFLAKKSQILSFYEKRQTSNAIREIMKMADDVNQWIAIEEPWKKIKDADPVIKNSVHEIASLSLNLFWILTVYLKPILPVITQKAENFLNITIKQWEDLNAPLFDHRINSYESIIVRLKLEDIEKICHDT